MNAPTKFDYPPGDQVHPPEDTAQPEKKLGPPQDVATRLDEVENFARSNNDAVILNEVQMMRTSLDGNGKYELGPDTGRLSDLDELNRMQGRIKAEDLRGAKGMPLPQVGGISPAKFKEQQAAPYMGPEVVIHQTPQFEQTIVPAVGMGAHSDVTKELRGRALGRIGEMAQEMAKYTPKKKAEKAPVVAAPVDAKTEAEVHAALDRVNAPQTKPEEPSPPAPAKEAGDIRAASWTGMEEPARTPDVIPDVPPRVIGGQEAAAPAPVSEEAVEAVVIHEQPAPIDPGTSGEKLRGFLNRLRGSRTKSEISVAPVQDDPKAIPATWAGQGELPVEEKPVEVPKPIGVQMGDVREQYGPLQKADGMSPAQFRAAQAAPTKSAIGDMPMVPPAVEIVPPPPPVSQPTADIIQMPKPAATRTPKVAVGNKGKSLKNSAPVVVPKPEDAIGGLVASPEKSPARGEKLLNLLQGRNKEQDSSAKKLGGKELVQMFRNAGEWYNNQNKWAKIGFGLGIGAGAALSLPFSSVAAGAFGGLIASQRVLGGLGRFVKIEMNLQKVHDGQELKGLIVPKIKILKNGHAWLAKQPENVRTTASATLAVLYSVAFSAAIGGAVGAVSKEVAPLLANLWPHGAEHAAAAPAVHHDAAPAAQAAPAHAAPLPKPTGGSFKMPPPDPSQFHGGGSGNPSINLAHGIPQDTAVYHAPGVQPEAVASAAPVPAASLEAFSMPVHSGDGAIKGIEHLKEQLIAKGYGANPSPAIKRLLEGDPTKLAQEYGLYKPGEALESARVFSDSSFGVDSNGNVVFSAHANAAPEVLAKGNPLDVKFEHHAKLAEVKARLGIKVPPSAPEPSHELSADDLNKDHALTHPDAPLKNPESVIGHQDGPIHPAGQEAPATGDPTPLHAAPIAEASVGNPEVPPAPAAIEHAQAFINVNKVPIDPTQPHIFEDGARTRLAYGSDFNTRFVAAQEFVKAHHDKSVWVQAKDPVFFNGALRPWVFEVKYSLFRGVQALIPNGPPDPSQIGGINPDTFTKQLDMRS